MPKSPIELSVHVALAVCYDYNDEYYYDTEGYELIGVYLSEREAWQALEEYYVNHLQVLAEEPSEHLIQEYVHAHGESAVMDNGYDRLPRDKEKFVRFLSGLASVAEKTVPLDFDIDDRLEEARLALIERVEKSRANLQQVLGQ